MTFDFDHPPSRVGTDSQKWQKYAGRDILPLWVADMDFKSPPALIEALQARVAHGIFGYARPVASTTEAVVTGLERLYGWSIDPAWIVLLRQGIKTRNGRGRRSRFASGTAIRPFCYDSAPSGGRFWLLAGRNPNLVEYGSKIPTYR